MATWRARAAASRARREFRWPWPRIDIRVSGVTAGSVFVRAILATVALSTLFATPASAQIELPPLEPAYRVRRPAPTRPTTRPASTASCPPARAGATRCRARRLPDDRRDGPALLRPAADVRRPRLRDAGAEGRRTSRSTSRTLLRRARRRRRAHVLAARGRHDRARPRLRRAARLRRDALGRDVRARLRRRRGPAVLHGRAAPRRPRRAVELRGRRQRGQDAEQWSVAPYTEADLERQVARPAEVPRRPGPQIIARRRELPRGRQPVHPRGEARPDASCRASTPRSGARRARTRSSRPTSSPPPRWSAASSARAAARSSSSRSSPTRSTSASARKHGAARVRATSAPPRTPRRR